MGEGLDARVGEHRVHAGELTRVYSREEMVEREHRVRLAAAKIGLKLHDRVAALARDALHATHEQSFKALGEERATEELLGLLVPVRPFAQMHLPEVGGELCLLIAAARDVSVRCYDIPPRLERTGRGGFDQ